MAYELLRKRKWAHLLPWVWMTFTFFYQSIQFVKTMRYLLPIYPTMALMAGYGLMLRCGIVRARRARCEPSAPRGAGWRCARRSWCWWCLGTAFWALAFTTHLHAARVAHRRLALDLCQHPAGLDDLLRGVGRSAAAERRRPQCQRRVSP